MKEWQFTEDRKLKCRIKFVDKQFPFLMEEGVDDDQIFNDYMMRKFLRFNIQIFKEHVPNAQRSQGASATPQLRVRNMICL